MKTSYLLVYLIILSVFSSGQSVNCDWINYSTGAGNYCTSVDIDNNNNIVMTGYFREMNFGGYNLLSKGTSERFNAFGSKFNSNGNLKWLISFGNDGNCMGKFIRCDKDNNIVLVGNFEGKIDVFGDTLCSLGNDDLFIIKFNSDGKMIWVRQIKSISNLSISSFEIDRLNNLYVLVEGSSNDDTYFDTIHKKSGMSIAKYDSNGNIIWVKETFSAVNVINSKTMSVSSTGDIYNTGSFSGTIKFADSILISKGYWKKMEELHDSVYVETADFFIAKITANGEDKWIRVIANNGDEYGSQISSNDKEIYISGYFTDSLTIKSDTTFLNGGQFILKYDTSGNLLNYRIINRNEEIENLKCNNQQIFTTGIRNSDIFVDKYDLELNLLQSFQTGGFNSDYGEAITTDHNGSVILGGIFTEKAQFGNFLIQNPNYPYGDFNLFIAKLNNNIVNINSIKKNDELYLFPNPVINKLFGKINFINKQINVIIVNCTGEILIDKNIYTDNIGSFEINLADLSRGIYIVKINNNKTAEYKRIIKI